MSNVILGLDVRNFKFITSYKEIEKFDFTTLEGNTRYSHILVGPMAHKQKGVKGYRSMIARLKSEDEDFPRFYYL